MNICDDDHDEICFETQKCPMCEMIKEKNREIASHEVVIDSLEDDIRSLESELEGLK